MGRRNNELLRLPKLHAPEEMKKVIGLITRPRLTKGEAKLDARRATLASELHDLVLRSVVAKEIPRKGTYRDEGLEISWEVTRGKVKRIDFSVF